MEDQLSPHDGQKTTATRLKRLGLAGKLFLGFSTAALAPIAIAIVASAGIYIKQSELVAREVVQEKVRSASLLMEERSQHLISFLESAARDNSILVNLELGLDKALEGYLLELVPLSDMERVWIFDSGGALRASSDDFPVMVSLRGGETIELWNPSIRLEDTSIPRLIGEIELESRGRRLGTTGAVLNLKSAIERSAAELGTPVFLLSLSGKLITMAVPGNPLAATIKFPPGWSVDSVQTSVVVGYIGEEKHFLCVTPYIIQGQRLAWVGIAYSVADLDAARNRGLVVLTLAFLAILALSGLAAVYFYRNIVKPVRSLATAARRISDGRYGATTGIALTDEIGELAQEFDVLSLALARQEEQRQVAEEALRQSEAKFRSIFDGVSEAIFVLDADSGEVVDVNRASYDLIGGERSDLIGRQAAMRSIVDDGFDEVRRLDLIRRAREGDTVRSEWEVRKKDGSSLWAELVIKKTRIGDQDRLLVSCRDINDRKKAEKEIVRSLAEKETLLKEIHHRVKNNFQIINSLFDLQESMTADPALIAGLREPRSRIQAMALVHERLYESLNYSSINLGDYVRELSQELCSAYEIDPLSCGLEVEADPMEIDIDRAVPCGLILNELVTNAIKYAFPVNYGHRGQIRIILKNLDGEAVLIVEDNGVGLPRTIIDGERSSLGLTLVEALVQQLRGKLHYGNGTGTRAEIRFKL